MEESGVADSELQCPDWLDYEVLFTFLERPRGRKLGLLLPVLQCPD